MRKIWWIRAMLIVFLALFIDGSVLAGELKNIIKKFTCNNIEITVLSQVSDEGDIQLQRIIFTDRTNMRKIKEINNKDTPGEKLGLKFTPPVIAISNSISIYIHKHTS